MSRRTGPERRRSLRRGPLRRGIPLTRDRRVGKHADEGYELSVRGGLAALSLDALSSVAYGPEAMVLVLVAAGSGALRFTLPLTLVITGMLALLVVSYTQVMAAHPEGGGAYAVAKINLGRVPALLAAASLFVDYVLTVAVSLAAGAASLGSVFPGLAHHLLLVTLIALVLLVAVNMFGIAESAKLLMVPTAVFIVSILAVIVVGPFHAHPVATIGSSLGPIRPTTALGIVLILKAFASGCSAVTGVEAIANGVPAFRAPRVRTAQRTEVSLGVLLGVMLVGLALLIRAHHLVPRGGVTILAQLTAGAFGTGWPFYVSNADVYSSSPSNPRPRVSSWRVCRSISTTDAAVSNDPGRASDIAEQELQAQPRFEDEPIWSSSATSSLVETSRLSRSGARIVWGVSRVYWVDAPSV